MSITVCSILTSVIICSIFTIVSLLAHTRNALTNSLYLLALLTSLCLVRLVFMVELPFSFELRSKHILPFLIDIGRFELFWLSGVTLTVSKLLSVVWIAGSVCCLIRLVLNILIPRYKLNRLVSTDNPIAHEIMACVVDEIRPGQRYSLIISNVVKIPQVYGFLKPTIIIPDFEFAENDYKHILGHELTHFTQHHTWIKLGVFMVWALFWWNPLMHILKRKINQILEVDCDRRMTINKTEEERSEYLKSTLAVMKYVANSKLREPVSSFGFIGPKDQCDIKERFQIVLAEKRHLSRWKKAAVSIALVLTFVLSYGVVVQPYAKPPIDLMDGYTYVAPSDTSYILITKAGDYMLYIDDSFVYKLDPEIYQNDSYLGSLPVIYE